ncbi:MAG: metallo-mystery pair system four-Cys motif protein [Nitrosomonadales bacterium]|nr:metallo-mystery pair system four-Cys motif protein [Nitrosomonadales bacterium]
MKTKLDMQRFAELGVAMTAVAALMAGCGGGSSSGTTTTVTGVVADGYLSNATVCLDKNGNSVCDAGEPSAITDANGAYSIAGVTTVDATAYPIVAEVAATSVDKDTNAAVGQAFTLTAPQGSTAVTPITSLVQNELQKNPSLTIASAVANVQTAAGIPVAVDPLKDYMAPATANPNVHKAAQVVAKSIMANMNGIVVPVADRKALQATLLDGALAALQQQGVTGASGVAAADPAKPLAGTFSVAYLAAAAAATQAVAINFDVVNGNTPVRCGDPLTLTNTVWDHTNSAFNNASALAAPLNPVQTQNTAGQMVNLLFYISEVKLIDANGNAVPVILDSNANQGKGVALLDFGKTVSGSCTTTYNTSIVGKVKPGTYTGISMTLGVPYLAADGVSRLNHSNITALDTPAPLQNVAMAWMWQFGRKFTLIEFKPTTPILKPAGATNMMGMPQTPNANATTTTWFTHLGSTGCTGDPATGATAACTNPNRLALSFPSFNSGTQKIVLDLAKLFAGADLTFDAGGPAGCMSGGTDPECKPIFNALGISQATGLSTGTQTVFSVK